MATRKEEKLNKAKDVARRYLNDVRAAGINYSEAYVFGSHSKGNPRPWSDIDLAVISKSFDNRFDSLRLLMSLKGNATIDVEPHPFSPKDFKDKYYPLANEVRKYGVKV